MTADPSKRSREHRGETQATPRPREWSIPEPADFGPGRGGWILLFVLLGLLLELPARLRDAVQRAQPKGLAAAVGISVLRWAIAGGILAALM